MANSTVAWYGDEIFKEITRATEGALWEATGVVEETAVAKAPVDRGQLKASGYRATNKRSNYKKISRYQKAEVKPVKGQAIVAFSAVHSHLLEFGTSHRAAKPFLRPAFDEKKDKVVSILTENIAQRLLRKFRAGG